MRSDVEVMKRQVEALVGLLEEWAHWQRGYRMKLGYPSRSCGVSSDAGSSFEDLCDSVDAQTMSTVDAVVNDLVPAQCAAVMKRYGVAVVFRFPRANYEQSLQDAHERLLVELPRKGCIVL